MLKLIKKLLLPSVFGIGGGGGGSAPAQPSSTTQNVNTIPSEYRGLFMKVRGVIKLFKWVDRF